MKKNLYFYSLGAAALLLGSGAAIAAHALPDNAPSVAAAPAAASDQLAPVAPAVKATFKADPASGTATVNVAITAPSTARDANYVEQPVDILERVELTRTDENGNSTLLNTWRVVQPGAQLTFDDTDELTPREEYTYSTRAFIRGVAGAAGYSYLVYGINPIVPDSPKLESDEGQAPVTVTYTCPAAETGDYYDTKPFPAGVGYTAINLYKYADGEPTLLSSQPNPTPGATYTYEDAEAKDGTNTYFLRTYTAFGFSADAHASIYLGEDYPGRIQNVKAVESNGQIIVSWDAPTIGGNGGHIDPAKTLYRLYRIDNDYFENPTLLADALSENRFIDDLAGLEGETMLYYRIYPYNDVEMPANAPYNYGETVNGVLAGPPAPLPFRETFNGGSKFNKLFLNKWEEDFDSYTFSSHFIKNDVTVENAGEPQYVTQGVDGPGNDETGADAFFYVTSGMWTSSTDPGYLTTGNLGFADASNPYLSFSYIPVAGSTGRLNVQLPTGEADEQGTPLFDDVYTLDYSLNADGSEASATARMSWQRVQLPLNEIAGKTASKVRFAFRYTDPTEGRYPMLLDHVMIEDFPGATDMAVEYKENSSTLLLTWNLPESAAGKQPLFTVYLNGEKMTETQETQYLYDAAEQGESYTFEIATRYPEEGIDAPRAQAERLDIPLQDFTLGDYYYVVGDEGNTVSLQGYEGSSNELVIPATVDYKGTTFKVNYLLPKLFNGHRKLKSVDIQAEIDVIPDSFFYGCVALESVTLPASVTAINYRAFFGCSSLKQIDLPASLVTIADEAFQNCLAMESVAFGAGVAEIGSRAFYRCQALANVAFASKVPPTVGDDAFAGIAQPCMGECPDGSTEAYAAVEQLSPITFPNTGVAAVAAEDILSTEYFSLTGARIAKPAAGEPAIIRHTLRDGSTVTLKAVKRP